MLLSVCKVISWLDWWLSTCGSFQKHLADEEHGHFERLMLSGLRALEFLGGQGVTALGVLVLSSRDSLLLAVRSTVWLKSSLAYVMLIFPRLLAFSLLFARLCPEQDARGFERRSCSTDLASTEASSEVFGGAGPGRVLGGTSPVVPQLQMQASTPPLLLVPSRVG